MWILLHAPASIGFQMHPKACYLTVNLPLALASLSNYPHMILFGIFFVVTALHFRLSGLQPLAWAIGATVAMGAGMEIAQGLSGTHHCKAIDLTPDFIGAMLGLLIVVLGRTIANARRARGDDPIREIQTVD
jgi:VanZ family protein